MKIKVKTYTIFKNEILFDGMHLYCDNRSKLHEYAKQLGLEKEWFHITAVGEIEIGHYDILSIIKCKRIIAEQNVKRHLITRRTMIAYLRNIDKPIVYATTKELLDSTKFAIQIFKAKRRK